MVKLIGRIWTKRFNSCRLVASWKDVAEGRRFVIGQGPKTGEEWRGYLAQLSTAPSEPSALDQSATFRAVLLDVNLDRETSGYVAAVLRTRGIPFVFGTGYDVSNVLPDDLAGSAIIS